MTSLGRQVFATFVDTTIQNLLYQLFAKSLQGSLAINIDSWKEDIKMVIDFVYSILSLEITYFEGIIKLLTPFSTPPKPGLTGSPAMTLFGLSWGQKGSTVVYIFLFLLRSAALKLHAVALSSGWSSDASSLKRSMAEALRIAIVAAKSLSIISFLTFLVRADGSPSLLLRLSGYRMSSLFSFPTNSVPYQASQLYLEQRKFMWLAMIGLASAVMVTIDWDHIGEITRRQYRSFTRTISLGIELTRSYFLPASEQRQTDGRRTNEFHRDESSDNATNDNNISCTRCLKSPPENAHRNSACGHVFCYLCIAPYVLEENLLNADNDVDPSDVNSCPLCSKQIVSAICWQPTSTVLNTVALIRRLTAVRLTEFYSIRLNVHSKQYWK